MQKTIRVHDQGLCMVKNLDPAKMDPLVQIFSIYLDPHGANKYFRNWMKYLYLYYEIIVPPTNLK